MARKLTDIKKLVEDSALAFYSYLENTEDPAVMQFIEKVSRLTNLFIFSGVIRNYFLGEKNNRDIDIILRDKVDFVSLLQHTEVKTNSFGGFKITCNKSTIDLWYLEHTWAFKNDHVEVFDFGLETKVPGTAFFNFSAIVYSLHDKKFYYTGDFVSFLKNQEIDYVYEKNPNYKLCVVNTFYYSDKYKLPISDRLKEYIVSLYKQQDSEYSKVQIKHFGKAIFTDKQIEHRVETIFNNRKKYKKRRIV